MKSLRRGLILRTTGACAIAFALAGAALYLSMRTSLVREFDHVLNARADAVAGVAEYNGTRLEVDWDELAAPDSAQNIARREFVQLFSVDGDDLARSPSLGEQQLPFIDITDAPRREFVTLANEIPARRITRRFTPRFDGDPSSAGQAARPVLLAIAIDARDFYRNLSAIAWQIAIVFLAAMSAAVAAVAYAISVSLRPLDLLAARIASHRSDDLSARIELADAPRELSPVVARLNELLDRIATLFEREKSFTADAAHELRTPLAGLTTTLEVCATQSRSPEEYRDVIERCLQTTRQMHGMTEALLMLSRADDRQLQVRIRRVGLLPLLEQCWQPFITRAEDQNIHVYWTVPDSVVLNTDPELLSIVLTTLLANALTHNRHHGWIRIEWNAASQPPALRISNSGCTLAPEQSDRVFDRFWQGDRARSHTGEHAGLGLSLCRRIMSLLNGRAAAEVHSAGVFEITLWFDPSARQGSADRSGTTPEAEPFATLG